MIDAYLVTADGNRREIRQPGDAIVIRRNKLEMEPGGPVATHQRHAWVLEGDQYVVTKVRSRVTVRLESGGGGGRTFGPFDRLWVVDGLVLADLEQGEPIAAYQNDGQIWRCTADGTLGESLILTQA